MISAHGSLFTNLRGSTSQSVIQMSATGLQAILRESTPTFGPDEELDYGTLDTLRRQWDSELLSTSRSLRDIIDGLDFRDSVQRGQIETLKECLLSLGEISDRVRTLKPLTSIEDVKSRVDVVISEKNDALQRFYRSLETVRDAESRYLSRVQGMIEGVMTDLTRQVLALKSPSRVNRWLRFVGRQI